MQDPVLPWTTAASLLRFLLNLAAAALTAIVGGVVLHRYPAAARKAAAGLRAAARHTWVCIFAAALLPLAVRTALLPWIPPPEPFVHDEFSHLLVADTLLHGRFANPPHPLWRHIETIYVLQHPAYVSVYPIGQGLILAAGKFITGSAWSGVLFAVCLMSGAICWMLFDCLPPTWAAAGGMLAALDYGLAQPWLDSYWGGAFCAFGGALFFGALLRLRRTPSIKMAALLALGWSVVWLIRPFESLLLLAISWLIVGMFAFRGHQRGRVWVGPVLVIVCIEGFAGCVTALHNRAATGSFTTMPYQADQRLHGVPQTFLWQKPADARELPFPELREMYLWQRQNKDWENQHLVRQAGSNLLAAWRFYVTPWYSLPLLVLVCQRRNRPALLAGAILASALAASLLYPFFFVHYIAAYSCVIFFLIMQGMILLWHWSIRGRPLGKILAVFLMSGGLMTGMQVVPLKPLLGAGPAPPNVRARLAENLERLGGRHVVFVRYGPKHAFTHEWVYNAADVDASPIVWCREEGESEDAEVARFYKDRQLWLAEVDADGERDTVRLSSYQPAIRSDSPTETAK